MSEDERFEHTGRVIRDEVRIDASPEVVYEAWADPDTITAWFVGRMEGRMRAGEKVTWHWDESMPGTSQEVVVADPPRRLVTKMNLPQGASYLEVTIEQEEGHTVVRLIQSGFGEGPEWDDLCEGMLSGWMIALAILKFFLERYRNRTRSEIVVLADADFEQQQILALQRTESGLSRWLSRSGTDGSAGTGSGETSGAGTGGADGTAPTVGKAAGQPVRLLLENGRTLTGTVLRTTAYETLWSWEEIDGVVEIKAFREPGGGGKVGVRVSSWMEDLAELTDLDGWLADAVRKLADVLTGG